VKGNKITLVVGFVFVLLIAYLVVRWDENRDKKDLVAEATVNMSFITDRLQTYYKAHQVYPVCQATPKNGGNDAEPTLWPVNSDFDEIDFRPIGDQSYFRYEVTVVADKQSAEISATSEYYGLTYKETVTPPPKVFKKGVAK